MRNDDPREEDRPRRAIDLLVPALPAGTVRLKPDTTYTVRLKPDATYPCQSRTPHASYQPYVVSAFRRTMIVRGVRL